MRKLNYKTLILCLCSLFVCLGSFSKNLHFIYIDHEETTPVSNLIAVLEDLRVKNTETDNALIVYLSNEYSPKIFCHNVDGLNPSFSELDAYREIVGELQESISNTVSPYVDTNTILDILTLCGFQQQDSESIFESVTMDFYVGPDLWRLGYNQSLIARLYFALEISSLDKNSILFNVKIPRGMKKPYDDGQAFGIMNVENLNSKLFRSY